MLPALLLVAVLLGRPEGGVPCDNVRGDSVRAVRVLIRCAVRTWSVPGGVKKALDVAECESHFRHDAFYKGHAGVFQHSLLYWGPRWREYGKRWGLRWTPYSARTNVLVTMQMVHDSGSWGPWSCA